MTFQTFKLYTAEISDYPHLPQCISKLVRTTVNLVDLKYLWITWKMLPALFRMLPSKDYTVSAEIFEELALDLFVGHVPWIFSLVHTTNTTDTLTSKLQKLLLFWGDQSSAVLMCFRANVSCILVLLRFLHNQWLAVNAIIILNVNVHIYISNCPDKCNLWTVKRDNFTSK